MTEAALSLVPISALESLSPQRRAFVLGYVQGVDEIRGIAYQAYLAAGYRPSTPESGYSASSQLLKQPIIIEAIAELRDMMAVEAQARLEDWRVLALTGQQYLRDIMSGSEPAHEQKIKVAIHCIDRAYGKPLQKIERDIGHNLDQLMRDLALGDQNRERLPETAHTEILVDGERDCGSLAPNGDILVPMVGTGISSERAGGVGGHPHSHESILKRESETGPSESHESILKRESETGHDQSETTGPLSDETLSHTGDQE